jgi:phage N-6-adenine-methyltransferase
MNTDLMFSSATDLWSTPPNLFDKLDQEFGFCLDVCASADNAKCRFHYTVEDDGLKQSWAMPNAVWMNPPYGRGIGAWVKKAYETGQKGTVVVCLLPARTDTAWWHDYCMKGEIRFIRGRLKFGGHKNSAPFPSAIVIFKKG